MAQAKEFDFVIINELFEREDLKTTFMHSGSNFRLSSAPAANLQSPEIP
jgi:hypothetical protein